MRDVKKDNLIGALCYIPLFAFGVYFLEEKRSERLNMHMRYGMILFVGLIIINTVLNALGLGFFRWITLLGYLVISIFLGFKVYSGEEIEVEILDNIDKKVVDKIGTNKKVDKKEEEIQDILKDM